MKLHSNTSDNPTLKIEKNVKKQKLFDDSTRIMTDSDKTRLVNS